MVNKIQMQLYLKYAWIFISPDKDSIKGQDKFIRKHGDYLEKVINFSQLTFLNLMIGLYYLFKYKENSVNQLDKEEDKSVIYIIITSLVLSNKVLEDLSYTLKTWLNILEQKSKETGDFLALDLKFLGQLESHFLSVLDFRLSYGKIGEDSKFWMIVDDYATVNNFSSSQLAYLKAQVTTNNYQQVQPPASVAPMSSLQIPSHMFMVKDCYNTPFMSETCSSTRLSSVSRSIPPYSPLTPNMPSSSDFAISLKKRKIMTYDPNMTLMI